MLGAWADAAFEGAEVPQASLRSGALEDSPVGRTAARTVAMYAEIPAVADLMTSAPLQALARLHAIVAVGSSAEVGRPRAADEVPDPLRSGTAVPAADATARLAALARLLTSDTAAPALAVAAIAHAEVAVTQPFDWGSGLVARSLTRVVMRAKGVDPDGWTIPEAGLRMFGRPRYVKALRAYASGEPNGMAEWLRAHSQWVTSGAAAATELVPDLPVDG
ncbi:MAG: hypothetical protein U0R64_01030 [Candidatus Nanopelagicales bacterium]